MAKVSGCRPSALAVLTLMVGTAAVGAPRASASPATAELGGTTSRVSVSSTGTQANGLSVDPAVSAHGRYVAFTSSAPNLVPGDTNDVSDVFVRDRLAGTTRRVSVGPGGRQANGWGSFGAAMSASGRYVAFGSYASNLVAQDTNGVTDVFVRDLLSGVTRRVSVGPGGRQGNLGSLVQAISGDGHHVAFASSATNLVSGDTNEMLDIFVRDVLSGATRRVSIGDREQQTNEFSIHAVVSGNGRYVAFESFASNLVPADTNGVTDIFLRDLLAGTTRRVSVGAGGEQADNESFTAGISADGRFVAFTSLASNLVAGDTNGDFDAFLYDRAARVTRRVLPGAGAGAGEAATAISADGRYVALTSEAADMVPGDTNGVRDVFVHDLLPELTRRVSVSSDGRQANAQSSDAAISADGRHVAFLSGASNLVPRDTNGDTDVFAWDSFGDVFRGR